MQATSSPLTITDDQQAWTTEQVAALRQLGADKATGHDLQLFFHQCKATGLDPFRRQIYLIGRFDSRAGTTKYVAQTSIDGYRIVADRSGVFAGCEETWQTDANGRLLSATVVARKVVAGIVCEFSATAHWDEYVQTTRDGKPMGLWAKLPHRMLSKCAEATSLRRAFANELGGIYTAEEMQQSDQGAPPVLNWPKQAPQPKQPEAEAAPLEEDLFEISIEPQPEPAAEPAAPPKAITASQVKRVHALTTKLGISDEQYRARLSSLYEVTTSKDLTQAQAADLIRRLEEASPKA